MKKHIFLLIILLFLFSNKAFAAEFNDINSTHLNFVSISHLSDTGILKGYDDGSYQPDRIMNRAEALKVIIGGAGINTDEEILEAPFIDVPIEQWFAKYVLKAKEMGIVKGNPDGTFAPSQEVKRVEFIKMLLETNRFRKDKWEGKEYFSDIPRDQWFAPYMNYAGKSGLIVPDLAGNLYPEKPVNRAEMAEILYLMRIIMKGSDTQYLLELYGISLWFHACVDGGWSAYKGSCSRDSYGNDC